LQSISPTSPSYTILDQTGPEHEKKFKARVEWEGLLLGEGGGGSKKQAETAAAEDALQSKRWEDDERFARPNPAQGNGDTPDAAHAPASPGKSAGKKARRKKRSSTRKKSGKKAVKKTE
jgi:hypothetical protein